MTNQMNSPYATYETDKDHEKNGRWADLGTDGEYLIARAGGANQKYARLLRARLKPHDYAMKHDQMDNEVAAKILLETFIDGCLFDWKVNGRDGQPLEFNRENAIQLFKDLPELAKRLQAICSDYASYRKVELEDQAGN